MLYYVYSEVRAMKQKILSILTVLAMLLSLIPMGTAASAEDSETLEWDTFSGTFKYIVLDDQTVEITGYKGKAVNLQIPSEIDGKPVTTIGFRAFYNQQTFQIITVPEGIKRFETFAFQYCFNVIMFKLPESLVSVSDNFIENTKYYNDLPDGPIYYDGWFLGFKGDTTQYVNYTVEPGTKRMAGNAFRMCRNIESVTLPDGISEIGDHCFANCSKLTSINFPLGIKRIGYNAFYGCTGLTSVDIPYGVTSIGPAAFRHCSNITHLTLPNTLELIENSAFEDCSSVTSVYVPDSVKQINQYSLGYTYNKTLGRYEKVPGFTIYSTTGSAAEKYAEEKGYAFVAVDSDYTYEELADGTVKITGYKGSDKELSLPSTLDGKTVSEIGASAFKDAKITYVSLPKTVKSIGSHAFENCGSLKTVFLNDGLDSIGLSAFAFCKSIETIGLPQGLTKIDAAAFGGCTSLMKADIPSSVNDIGYGVFDGCSKLIEINVAADNGTYSSVDGVLFNKDASTLIKFPMAKAGDYTVPDGVMIIDDGAFYRAADVTSITMPDSVTTVGSNAFNNCGGLQSIKLSGNLQTIGEYAFEGCGNVKTLELPKTLNTVPKNAFGGWSSLQSLTVPSGITAVGEYAFESNNNLKEVTIAASVASIGEKAFGYVYNYSTGDYDKVAGFTVKGSLGSAAEKYAKDNGFNFVAIDEPTEPTTEPTTIKPTEPTTEPTTIKPTEPTTEPTTIKPTEPTTEPTTIKPTEPTTEPTTIKPTEPTTEPTTIKPTEPTTEPTTIKPTEPTTEPTTKEYEYRDLDDGNIEIIKYNGNAKKLTVPSELDGKKVTSIGDKAFEGKALTTVTIPDGVKTIGDSAFADCADLTRAIIPNSVITVGDNAFVGCGKLTFIVIPKSVTSLGEHSFGFVYDKENDKYEKVENFTVYGNKGAESEKYAKTNEFKFVDLDETPCDFYISEASVATSGELHRGDTVKLLAVIGNSSANACVQPFSVSFYINGRKAATVTSDQLIAENGRVKVTASVTLNANFGTSTIAVVVNQEKSVNESDYGNNVLKSKIVIADD